MGHHLILHNIEKSLAATSWSSYKSSWLLWLQFLDSEKVRVCDASEHLVLSFLESLMRKEYSWSHVYRTLSGISFFQKMNSLTSCLSYFSVKQALKGYKKSHFQIDNRHPITPEILSSVCSITDTVCFSSFEAVLFNAVFAMAFFAALRVS